MNLVAMLLIGATALSPPSGRPPIGPLERVEPKLYDLRFDVTLTTVIPNRADLQRVYVFQDAPIVMPVIFRGTYSHVYNDSLSARLWLLGREDVNHHQRSHVDEGLPFHAHLMVMPIAQFRGTALRWQLNYRVQAWSSRIDEQAAARLTWPQVWPAEVGDGLRPSHFIESDEPIFANSIQRLTNGNLHLAPPYLAAKEVVRYTISRFQVSGNGTDRDLGEVIRGLNVKGALASWQNGLGTEHDLALTCVAMLRAAEIPARVVVGVTEEIKAGGRERNEFVSWCEFYLDGAGWIPFDPNEMRGQAIGNRNLRDPWPDFGTLDELNERIPLAYSFIPPVQVEAPWKYCVWGWNPTPGGDPGTIPAVTFTITKRGKGQDDPR